MARKRISLNYPDRQPDEPDATEKQLGYIRSFEFGLSEKVLQGLGKWQASNIIDQMVKLRDEGYLGESASKTMESLDNAKSGCGCSSLKSIGCILVLIVTVLLVLAVTTDDNELETEPSPQKPISKTTPKPASTKKTVPEERAVAKDTPQSASDIADRDVTEAESLAIQHIQTWIAERKGMYRAEGPFLQIESKDQPEEWDCIYVGVCIRHRSKKGVLPAVWLFHRKTLTEGGASCASANRLAYSISEMAMLSGYREGNKTGPTYDRLIAELKRRFMKSQETEPSKKSEGQPE